jgi:hypothetical protein
VLQAIGADVPALIELLNHPSKKTLEAIEIVAGSAREPAPPFRHSSI